jgi:hypothetical protein
MVVFANKRDHGEELGMKQMLFAAAFTLSATAAHAQGYGTNPSTHATSGYTTSRGTVVQPYVATNTNGTQRDNFSSPATPTRTPVNRARTRRGTDTHLKYDVGLHMLGRSTRL